MLNKKVIKGSIVLFIAFGLFNFFNFIYQFAMARFLSIVEYGILAALFSIIYIFSVFSESIQTVIAKYTASIENKGQLKNLLNRSMKKGSILGLKLLGVYLLLSLFLSYLSKIPYFLLAINGLVMYIVFLLPVSRGAIQGRKNFFGLGTNLVVESLLKILFSIGLVLIGWKVYGAIIGVVLGTLVAFVLSFISLRDIYKSEDEKFNADGIYSYAKPTIFITAIVVLFYSADVILAKILFSPEIAGSYAIASILGKVIFWSSVPIGKAMFPLSAESNKQGKLRGDVFATTILILAILILGILTVFYLFSDWIVLLFSGKNIPDSSSVLFYLGTAFSIISIANVILLYQLSIGKIRKYGFLTVCNFIQLLLLLLFSQSLKMFSIAFIGSSVIFLIGAILFSRANRHI